jgi:hypothetical protein
VSYREAVADEWNQICLAKSPNNVLSEAKEVNGNGRVAVNGQVLNGMESLREHPDGEPAESTFASIDASENFNLIHPPDFTGMQVPDGVSGMLRAELLAEMAAFELEMESELGGMRGKKVAKYHAAKLR